MRLFFAPCQHNLRMSVTPCRVGSSGHSVTAGKDKLFKGEPVNMQHRWRTNTLVKQHFFQVSLSLSPSLSPSLSLTRTHARTHARTHSHTHTHTHTHTPTGLVFSLNSIKYAENGKVKRSTTQLHNMQPPQNRCVCFLLRVNTISECLSRHAVSAAVDTP